MRRRGLLGCFRTAHRVIGVCEACSHVPGDCVGGAITAIWPCPVEAPGGAVLGIVDLRASGNSTQAQRQQVRFSAKEGVPK